MVRPPRHSGLLPIEQTVALYRLSQAHQLPSLIGHALHIAASAALVRLLSLRTDGPLSPIYIPASQQSGNTTPHEEHKHERRRDSIPGLEERRVPLELATRTIQQANRLVKMVQVLPKPKRYTFGYHCPNCGHKLQQTITRCSHPPCRATCSATNTGGARGLRRLWLRTWQGEDEK